MELQTTNLNKRKLHPDYEYTMAEVVGQFVMKWLEQLMMLARRVRLLFLDARAAVASCEKVAKLLQRN
jgi:glycerol-3-phosphate dehydrogenase